MENCVFTTSSEDEYEEQLFCRLCENSVTYNSSQLKSHINQHLAKNDSCGNFLYFYNKKMPIQETPKSRNMPNMKPRRSRTFSGPIKNTRASQTSPRPPHFIHEPSPRSNSSLSSPVHKYHLSKLPLLIPGRVVESEPTRPLCSVPLRTRRTADEGREDEKETLISDKERKSWFDEAEVQVLSKLSDVECPKCFGRGPFINAMKSTGNMYWLSSCLEPFLSFVSCCLPQPRFEIRICCSRCKHLILEFDSQEPWLNVK